MLKINKILSKKIKFPLSLRGAKRRGNLSGFSLIELMVAVAILALAIFGIFQAYSVGFMGMADARDRTVATNYAREAMEDVKNMDFEKITTTTKSVINANKKYRVDVNVSSEIANLKKVITVVSWKDRNGTGKTVETTMLVNFIEVYASEAAKIVLFADSYTILDDSTTELTAIIKDIKGNTITDWGVRTGEDDIYFSIFDGDGYGNLSYTNVTPINGIAKTNFTYFNELLGKGVSNTIIMASVNLPSIGSVSDQVTIKATNGPVKIMLSADPDIIKASTENNSTITVSLCDAVNRILKKSELVTGVEITFSVFGEGNLSTSTIIISAIGEEPASEEIILNSTGNPGLVSIVATATDLESDTVDVRFLGAPVSILITANPNPIYVDDDDGSTITVSLLDINGFCTNPTEDITLVNFILSPDTNGLLSPSSLSFTANEYEGIPLTTIFSGQTSTDPVTITTENEEGLTEDSVTISILSALVPDHIELTASSQNVVAGGSSTITATIYDGGRIVTNYNGTVTFETTLGTFSNDTVGVNNGKATTVLTSDFPGNAIIKIIYPAPTVLPFNPSDGLVIGFYGGADHIELKASPQNVVTGGSSIITATVCDSNYIHVSDYEGTIIFTIVFEGLSYDSSVDTTNGIAFTVLSFDDEGTAIVTAVDSLNELTVGNVEVGFYVETDLTLVTDSAYYDSENLIVGFIVNVVGENITVDQMKVSWVGSSPSQRFEKIVINGEEVYIGNDKSDAIIEINDITLSPGEYTIKLTFIQDMTEKNITVVFYPYYTGMYEVNFITTTQ